MTLSPQAVLKRFDPTYAWLTNVSFQENSFTDITSCDLREGTVTGKKTKIIYRREHSHVLSVRFYNDYRRNITYMN
jgi:hypothetical protein